MIPKNLLIFDFDGVLCNSINECLITSYNAYNFINGDLSSNVYHLEKIPSKDRAIKKCKKKIDFFKNCTEPEKILPKKNWFKK